MVPPRNTGGSHRCVKGNRVRPSDEQASHVAGCSVQISESSQRMAQDPIRLQCVTTVDTLGCVIQNTQIAPALHPPLNLTSNSGPTNWTVSFVRGSQIFVEPRLIRG